MKEEIKQRSLTTSGTLDLTADYQRGVNNSVLAKIVIAADKIYFSSSPLAASYSTVYVRLSCRPCVNA